MKIFTEICRSKVQSWPVVLQCASFVLILLFWQLPGACFAAEQFAATGSDDVISYMMERDALKLNGTVVRVRRWNDNDASWLASEYFEPLVVTVDVRNRSGQCFGNHDFYLKKGVGTEGLEPGATVIFYINKNMCHPDKALIIMNLNVLKSTVRR